MQTEPEFLEKPSSRVTGTEFVPLSGSDFLRDWQQFLHRPNDDLNKNFVACHQALPEAAINRWRVATDKSDKKFDTLTLTAEQTVTVADFRKQNPDAPQDLSKSPRNAHFKLRHPTTGEVDDGWQIAATPDGKVKLTREYEMRVLRGDHKSLIERTEGVPPEFQEKLQKKLDQLPANVLQNLREAGYKIIAAPTIKDALPGLAGLTPRGWDRSSTFDNSDGTHDNVSKRIISPMRVIWDRDWGPVERDEVVVHQIGHALDFANGFLSARKEFIEAYEKDMARVIDKKNPIISYLSQREGVGRQETFATLFGLVLTGPENATDKEFLEKTFPETIKVVKQQIAGLSRKTK